MSASDDPRCSLGAEAASFVQRAECGGLLSVGFDLVTHVLARMLAWRGVPGEALLIVLFDTQDEVGRRIVARIREVTQCAEPGDDDLAPPYDACALPLRLELARRVFEGHADVERFLTGEVQPGYTRVLSAAAGAWITLALPIEAPETAGDA